MESEESYLIELPHRRADAICAEFNRDFDRLADSLQVLNRRLVLLHPVSCLASLFRNSWIASLLCGRRQALLRRGGRCGLGSALAIRRAKRGRRW